MGKVIRVQIMAVLYVKKLYVVLDFVVKQEMIQLDLSFKYFKFVGSKEDGFLKRQLEVKLIRRKIVIVNFLIFLN